ncbi:MAG: regulatory iron-sulfur-containing complex subunit RicT [Planctomycetota bacterium]
MVQQTINLDVVFPPEPPQSGRHGCGGCGSGESGERCGNGLEKIYPTTAVRFGYMRYIGEFSHAPDVRFTCGAKVVIQTRRGTELGEQVSLTCGGCDRSVTRDKMKEWVAACGEDAFLFDAGRILREATGSDLAEYAKMQSDNLGRRGFCQQLAKRSKVDLKVVDCESLFGGDRIIFYFTAVERVDFRPIVKDLADEYRTRIEMRQIGARDEARLVADYETCGREVCCKVFLKTLKPITMRMAKLQKATLEPSQVSGRCGRLKCCLRYEHESYEDLDNRLPKTGVRIRTSHGDGVIVNRQVLTQLVQIRMASEKLITVVAEDILEVGVPAAPRPSEGVSKGVQNAATPGVNPRSSPERTSRSQPIRKAIPPVPPAPRSGSKERVDGGAVSNNEADSERERPGEIPGEARRRRRRRQGPRNGPPQSDRGPDAPPPKS